MNVLRPVGIFPFLWKVSESAVKIMVPVYVEINEILPTKQLGFRKYHSTTIALLNLTDNIIRSHKEIGVHTLFGSFDQIDYKLLSLKPKYYVFLQKLFRVFKQLSQQQKTESDN